MSALKAPKKPKAARSVEIELDQIVLLSPDTIEPMPDQPRQERDTDFENELFESILSLRESGEGIAGTGIIEPLSLFVPSGALDERGALASGRKLQIFSGHTRWRMAQRVDEARPDLKRPLPVIIEDMPSARAFELAFFANRHRRDMPVFDEARALKRIKDAHGFGYEQLARYTNTNKEYVRARLKILGDQSSLQLLQARPDALHMAKRISQVADDELKTRLVELAMNGASYRDIEDSIAAARNGTTLEKYRAVKQIAALEKAHEQEAAEAKSWAPADLKSPPSRDFAPSRETPRPETLQREIEPQPEPFTPEDPRAEEPETEPQSPSAPVAPRTSDQIEQEHEVTGSSAANYIGDAFDVLLRQLADTSQSLRSSRLSSSAKTRLREKSALMRERLEKLETEVLS